MHKLTIKDYVISFPFIFFNKRLYKTLYFNLTYKEDIPFEKVEVRNNRPGCSPPISTCGKLVKTTEEEYIKEKEKQSFEKEYEKEMESPFLSLIKTLLGQTIPVLEFSVIEDSHYRGITITLNRIFHIKNDDNAIYNNMGISIGGWDSISYNIEVFLTAEELLEHSLNPGENSVLARTIEALVLIYKKQVMPGELYKVNGTTTIFKETHGDNWSFVVMDGDKAPLSTTRFGVSAIKTIEKMES